jgi:DNA processing protein
MPPITILPHHEIPDRLKRTHPSPKRLYVRGNMPDFSRYKCLAVVGARKFSPYGAQACRELVMNLRGYPIIIISGLAIGIDSISHQAALDAGLITVAVPGSGLNDDVIYPKQKRGLAADIINQGGCLISEYPPDMRADVWTFPERNRLMAGLCDAVLVVEAEQKSGTLITARIALDYNKDVLAVSGSIFSTLSEGPHFLISQGATPIRTSRDIVEALGLIWYENEQLEETTSPEEGGSALTSSLPESDSCRTKRSSSRAEPPSSGISLTQTIDCSEKERELLTNLAKPQTRDELARASNMTIAELQTTLSLLELKGLITEEHGSIRLQQ